MLRIELPGQDHKCDFEFDSIKLAYVCVAKIKCPLYILHQDVVEIIRNDDEDDKAGDVLSWVCAFCRYELAGFTNRVDMNKIAFDHIKIHKM